MYFATWFWSSFVQVEVRDEIGSWAAGLHELRAGDLVEDVLGVVAGDGRRVGVAAFLLRRQVDLDERNLREEPLRLVEVADHPLLVLLGLRNAWMRAASLPA